MKASAWFNEHICNSGSFPSFSIDKDPVMRRGPVTEMKSPAALLSLFTAYARQVKNSRRIHDDKYTVSDHCLILKLSPV